MEDMMNAISITARDLGHALTMLPRPRGVAEIVADVFGPIDPGRNGRRAIEQRNSLAAWAGRQLNLTDHEMRDQFDGCPSEWDGAERRTEARRAEFADWQALCDAVMAKLEDE